MHTEEIAYEKGYRSTKDGEVIGLHGYKLKLHLHKTCNRKYFYCEYNGKVIGIPVHRLVAYEKYGRRLHDKGMVTRHKNGNRFDNSWDNILIGTQSENMMDKSPEARKWLAMIGAKAQRKLSEEEVQQLRRDRDAGSLYSELMAKYGIAKSTVSYIVNKHTYKN